MRRGPPWGWNGRCRLTLASHGYVSFLPPRQIISTRGDGRRQIRIKRQTGQREIRWESRNKRKRSLWEDKNEKEKLAPVHFGLAAVQKRSSPCDLHKVWTEEQRPLSPSTSPPTKKEGFSFIYVRYPWSQMLECISDKGFYIFQMRSIDLRLL